MEHQTQDAEIENDINLPANDQEEPFALKSLESVQQPHLLEAGVVYILLPRDVSITRMTRIQWLLDHIDTVITVSPMPSLNFNSNELEIISVLPVEESSMPCSSYLVTTCTEVIFLAQTYRFIYCLDMSPSQSTVDVQQGEILFDQIINCFKVSLQGLCQKFTLPGCAVIFQPCIYLTVIVNTPFFISPAQQVLVKGVQVSSHNMKEIISSVEKHFHILEGRIAEVSALAYEQIDSQIQEHEGMVGTLFDIIDNERIANIPMVSPDANFVNMLRYSMLAISLLPENSLSHILVITDGVVAMPDSNVMESLLYQLHYDGIALSFLKVGSSFHPHSSAGYVSYTDLLHFLSHTTLGSYLEDFPVCNSEDTVDMNIYHKLYLLWTFHSKSKYMSPISVLNQHNWIIPNEKSYKSSVPTLLSKKQTEEKVNASILLLITRRLREGYSIINLAYNNRNLEIKLSLHWKTFIFIHYVVKAQWPIVKNLTHIEVYISAPYDFLHDITCMMKKETKSSYRQAVFERFWIRLTQLASNDTLLAQQLSSFQNANTWYTLPDSVRNGIPVFNIIANVQSCDLNKLMLSASDVINQKFIAVWQPICQIENNNWRKWFHTHKFTLILKHDYPLPKHIHTANSLGRFQIIQCRQAASALYTLLAEWASFILIDNHTYLKLLYKDNDKPPVWFCVIRVSSKFPCTTITLAFLTGTPGYIRFKVCSELKNELKNLPYLSSALQKKDNQCCVLLNKPLEKILIRYERMPTDFYTVVFPDGTQPPQDIQSFPMSPFAGALFTTLSRYLFHQRWIWSASYSNNSKLNVNALSRILSTITRMRLKEGFHFAHSSSGIVTMVLELTMEPNANSCAVQYVLFPPHSTWIGERDNHSGSEEDADPDSELDYELQIVTEVWIEPQYGYVKTNNERLKYLNNIPYYEIAEVIRLLDMKCINSLLTLEHLSLMCQEKSKDSFDDSTLMSCKKTRHRHNSYQRTQRLSTSESISSNYDLKSQWSPCFVQRIQHIPFQFDPIEILPVCQQTELLFSMFIDGGLTNKDASKTNKLLLENLQNHFVLMHDCEIYVSDEECVKFTKAVIERHKNKIPHSCPISLNNPSNTDETSHWRCFAKGISVTHVILTFVPATLEDLKILMKYEPDNLNSSSENVDRASSQASNYSEVPINSANSLSLPIYIYDCPLALLVESFISNVDSVLSKDVNEDHRYKCGLTIQEECINLKTDDSENVSPEPKSDDSDVEQKGSVKQHCKALVLTHSKCFAMSLFTALHYQELVHRSDVQSAMDQCEETIYEIDITDYIKTICAHIKHSETDNVDVSYLRQPTPCLQFKSLHRLIKEKFFAITNKAFEPIPSNNEFYYCKNLSYERSDLRHNDSDDEVSNPASEIIEFKDVCSQEPSTQYFFGKTEPEVYSNEMSPLFLHFICTIRYGNVVDNAIVKVLPTCLGELIEHFDPNTIAIPKSKLQMSLDILCLTLPMAVQNVINDYSTKGLRTTSFCSDGFQPSIGSSVSEASFNSDYKEPDPLMYVPDLQKKAINTLRDEINWLLQDEIATSLLDVEPVTTETLEFVMKHVLKSTNRSSCKLDVIHLNFVYGSSQSYEKFVQEFSKIVIPEYKLLKNEDVYYLAKDHSLSNMKKSSLMSLTGPEKASTENRFRDSNDLHSDESFDLNGDVPDNDMKLSQSDTSSINDSVIGTEGGYDESVSECDEDYEWLIDLNNKRPNLPNFWLILQIDQDAVTIYFHCRFLELSTTHVGIYLQVQRAISDAIREICKRVNQSLLLQSLHDTRTCDHLLEPDDNFNEWPNDSSLTQLSRNISFSRLKSMDEVSDESEPYPTALIEASLKFTTGYFTCPVVFEMPFFLHPRLKTGPGKSGIAALKSVLDKFSVSNRSNMFVYQDKDANVFYLRLHENLQSGYCRSFKSNEFEQPVSRSPSIASLPLSQQKSNLARSDYSLSSTGSEIRPRVRSFGEKETKDIPGEDTIVLRVHGITEAGQDVRCELVQVLQKRLDDAVLEFLSVMLARNAMCPLTPEDVRFLQKPFKAPEFIIKLSIPECALQLLNPFTHYLRQNLLQFLNVPKYTDARSSSHFKDYTQPDHCNRQFEDNIFIYNQSQNPSSGNRGIACIALAIIDKTETCGDDAAINIEEIFRSKKYDEIVRSTALEDKDNLPEVYLEIRLWTQGRVNIDNLRNKLSAASSQAAWDIIMEYFILKTPLCEPIQGGTSKNQLNTLNSEAKLVETNKEEFFLNVLLDTTNEDELAINFMKDYNDCQYRSRKGTMNSQSQRSISFDDNNKEKELTTSDLKFDNFELGDDGTVTEVYSKILKQWLEFGFEINTPSIKKTMINLYNHHFINITIKELQTLILQLSQDAVNFFTFDYTRDLYVPYVYSHSSRKCLMISRNFEQWKGSSYFHGSLDFPDILGSQNLKHIQKFGPIVINDKQYIPRQKILWGIIETDNVLLYTYNWSKDNIDKLTEYGKNIGLWLSVRAGALNSVIAQKLGLFHNQAISRKSTFMLNNPYLNYVADVDNITKFSKERSKKNTTTSNNVQINILEAFKDTHSFVLVNNVDPSVAFTVEMYEKRKYERKCREELKKLHCMYQSRTNSCSHAQIDILLQNSRVIHYCHTPLLFLSRWRLQAAATRDHSINSPKLNLTLGKYNEAWFDALCMGFISEYKKYLQTLGFMSLHIDNGSKKLNLQQEFPHTIYIQKTILGGILVFTIQLIEPFFITKLHAIECNRLQSTNSRTAINQFTQSFIDECDRIKIFMHLHSFTYDFHLRCIHNYVSNSNNVKVSSGYHVIQFLEDFMKYYNKAPNYARNLIHSDTITISNLRTEGKLLYKYLIDNVIDYDFNVFKMQHDAKTDNSEYILVQVSNTPQVSYKDSQDRQHTDDFVVTLIVSNINNCMEHCDNTINLKYYLILTSRREIFPKSDVERQLGKFRTVSSTSRNRSSLRVSECENIKLVEDIKPFKEKSTEQSSNNDEESSTIITDSTETTSSVGKSLISSHIEIKQESVNYLGYYSSHEQLMQQLILDCANATQKKIGDMVMQGMVHCRTHLLWNKLILHHDNNQLSYEEFAELTSFSKVENLCDLSPNLTSLLVHQPLSWYQGLTKLLLSKYQDQRRSYISPDGNVQHHVMLHQGYAGAFMMLKMDLHTNRGDLYAVYRNSHKVEESNASMIDRKALLDDFISCVCFYLWTGMF